MQLLRKEGGNKWVSFQNIYCIKMIHPSYIPLVIMEGLTSIISIYMNTALHVWWLLILKSHFPSLLDLLNLSLHFSQWLLGLTKELLSPYLILYVISKKVMLQINRIFPWYPPKLESKQNGCKPSRRCYHRLLIFRKSINYSI